MSSLRIIAGDHKGKKIPFTNQKFNQARITSQKLKGALFSLLGEDLTGKSFFDLYAGSGQISFEAISRKANLIILNEKDLKRYNYLKKTISIFPNQSQVKIFNEDCLKLLPFLEKKQFKADYLFLDPPYQKNRSDFTYYAKIMERISFFDISNNDSLIIIQHDTSNKPLVTLEPFKLFKTKRFGNSSLAIYHKNN